MTEGNVTVRFWAFARELVGSSEVELEADDLDDVQRKLAENYGSDFRQVLDTCSLFVNGEKVNRVHATKLNSGAVVEVMPPYSGG